MDTIDIFFGDNGENGETGVVKMTDDVKFIPGTFILDEKEAEKAQEMAALIDPGTFGTPPSVLRAQAEAARNAG